MKTRQIRASAVALAIVLSLSVAAPAFALRDDTEPRTGREHVTRLIAKIKSILRPATNDGLGIPVPSPKP